MCIFYNWPNVKSQNSAAISTKISGLITKLSDRHALTFDPHTAWTYLRHEVSKSDRGHGNEDKVEGLEEPPFLPGPVYDGPHEDVDQQDDDGH